MGDATGGPSLLLLVLDLSGIFVFAISGALVAVRRRLDVFGVLVLAGTTGLGGGFLRDVLIDATPPAALSDWRYLLVPVLAGLLTFAFHPALGRAERVVTLFDAAGLGLFCVTGAVKALEYGLGPVPAALMGMVTGIGGGIARDLLAGRTPAVFSSELYATPALLGATWAVLATLAGFVEVAVTVPGALLCFGLRMLALWRDWKAPLPRGPASV
ncbi:trimeric intracellular cation channel family protein [Nocardioides aurantiacus]|uniref:Putative membrane protein YeiH n=1 Tax=Nocardioides aurantiacus TaxID=86796 RepID=A0A3N2CUY8_9ACTN|nr:trimeric intracellular cation channel family protein [Nocardioides aurantiacus]ROR91357.1 putative membrane protein YeiH [Nocardioides aurantiacus]